MNAELEALVLNETHSTEICQTIHIQDLWSGYGVIEKIALAGGDYNSVIVKHIKAPNQSNHPRGWNSDLSHRRKINSYQVECNWYENYSGLCTDSHRIPQLIAKKEMESEFMLILEDLDDSGYEKRCYELDQKGIASCLMWLASFHANFLNTNPKGLWDHGCYWHLETRPDELEVLTDKTLIKAAPIWDHQLNNAKYKTLVHGDAKTANFCFSSDLERVSAVDFQYVGAGCGMKDVAYFMSSCLDEDACVKNEGQILEQYFTYLKSACAENSANVNFSELEEEWRTLYPIAWCDFLRFLKGWSPGHWKVNNYSQKMLKIALSKIK